MADSKSLYDLIVANGIDPQEPVATIAVFNDPAVQSVPHVGMLVDQLPQQVYDAMANPDDFDAFVISAKPNGVHLTPLGRKGAKHQIRLGEQVTVVLSDKEILIGQDEVFWAQAEMLLARQNGQLT